MMSRQQKKSKRVRVTVVSRMPIENIVATPFRTVPDVHASTLVLDALVANVTAAGMSLERIEPIFDLQLDASIPFISELT